MNSLETAARFVSQYDQHASRTLWRKEFEGGWVYEPAVSSEGDLYVGGGRGELLALDPQGELRWKLPVGLVLRAPVLSPDEQTVYVATQESQLMALGRNGNLLWEQRLGYGGVSTPVLTPGGGLLAGSLAGELVAFTPQGEPTWSFKTRGGIQQPALATPEGEIFLRDDRGTVYALDAAGQERWKLDTQGCGPLARNADGLILVSDWKDLKAVDPASGQVRWQVPASIPRDCGPTVASDGTIFVPGHDKKLQALNPDGSEKWRAEGPVGLATTPLLSGDQQTVVVRGWDRQVLVFGAEGGLRWVAPTYQYNGASIMSKLAVGRDGTVYAGSQDSSLAAFKGLTAEEQLEAARSHRSDETPGVHVGREWVVIGGTRLRPRQTQAGT
ncbi:MAG: hypothetical protein AMXMBFR33_19400 [Candidatus Xenobia bacterium]|jgi:outer membrane protein assembly factor BamB